jgi:hypothetical protein
MQVENKMIEGAQASKRTVCSTASIETYCEYHQNPVPTGVPQHFQQTKHPKNQLLLLPLYFDGSDCLSRKTRWIGIGNNNGMPLKHTEKKQMKNEGFSIFYFHYRRVPTAT